MLRVDALLQPGLAEHESERLTLLENVMPLRRYCALSANLSGETPEYEA